MVRIEGDQSPGHVATETVMAAHSGVGAMDDDGHGDGPVRLALSASSCPMRAQIGPPRGVLPAQGVVALFPEKRKVTGST